MNAKALLALLLCLSASIAFLTTAPIAESPVSKISLKPNKDGISDMRRPH